MATFGRSRNISESSAALQERLDPGSESTGATAGPWVRPHEASGTGPSAGAGAGAEAAAWRPGSQSALGVEPLGVVLLRTKTLGGFTPLVLISQGLAEGRGGWSRMESLREQFPNFLKLAK